MVCKLSDNSKLLLQRILALVIGCLCCLVAGLAISLPIFVNAIKDTFLLMQTDIEILIAMFSLGAGIMILPGIVLDKFGHRPTNVIGGALISIGIGLVISSTYRPRFYMHQGGLLTAYFFLAGHGTAYLYMSAMTVNMLNFPPKHRGKVMMLLDSFYSCSPVIFAPIYHMFFANGHYNDLTKQDLDGFFWFLLAISLVASVGGVFAMPKVKYPGQEEELAEELSENDEDGTGNVAEEESKPILEEGKESGNARKSRCPRPKMNPDFLASAASRNYQLIMWTTTIVGAICNVVLGNTTAMSRSMRITDKDLYLSLCPALFGIVVHVVLGPVSDMLLGLPGARAAVLLGTSFGVLLGQLLLVAATHYTNALAALIAALSFGQTGQCGISLAYVIYSESFAKEHLGKLIGIALLIQNLMGLMLQTIYGAIYDSQTEPQVPGEAGNVDGHTCYGARCFRFGLLADILLNSMAIGLNIWYLVRVCSLHKKKQQEKEEKES